nr:hypothetical protein BaRGS_027493 [Batillaria attramentaria]
MQALAMHNNKRPVMLPSKRTSVNYQGQQRRERQDSSSDDDSVIDEELRSFQRGGGARDSGASSSSYSDHGQGASPYHLASATSAGAGGERPRSQHYANYAIPGNTARHALADVMQNARHCIASGMSDDGECCF